MASKNTIEIVKSTAPVLQQYGEAITKQFYKQLFEKHPELKNIFNMTHQAKGDQPRVLASAIFQYATYIDQLDMLKGAVSAITQKHSSLSITPEMYPIVGENLLEAIKVVLGDAATPEIIDAWAEAYGDLASLFIKEEEKLYSERENMTGGYRGKKKFKVVKRVAESSVITSFYLAPADGSALPPFQPGQYIAVSVEIPGESHLHTRNYSLSDFGNQETIRISVKKEEGNPNGTVSNFLHASVNVGDQVEIGIPAGDFKLEESTKPVVLIAGGVGITPLISMYKALAKTDRKVTFIQCALNSETHAFRNEIAEHLNENSKSVVIYNESLEHDEPDYKGLLTADILKAVMPEGSPAFYFCGPKPFMADVMEILQRLSVEEEDIHFEFFGPMDELKKSECPVG
ncbi:NO-inducible flavohemoprotein [Limibacter armeniacum]|uniref:NO-inducible flavohemoprotein n=1 Tax=Limibacter armeniacum TaxID=466084 RepID=UPI002FE6BA43